MVKNSGSSQWIKFDQFCVEQLSFTMATYFKCVSLSTLRALIMFVLDRLSRFFYNSLLQPWENKRAKMALDPWFFEIALAILFLSFSEKNLQEFLYVCTVQEASIH